MRQLAIFSWEPLAQRHKCTCCHGMHTLTKYELQANMKGLHIHFIPAPERLLLATAMSVRLPDSTSGGSGPCSALLLRRSLCSPPARTCAAAHHSEWRRHSCHSDHSHNGKLVMRHRLLQCKQQCFQVLRQQTLSHEPPSAGPAIFFQQANSLACWRIRWRRRG